MNIGEKIYELRTKKNLSQGDLADKLDVSRQSVSKWENNTAVPDLDKLIKLCDVFEISLDEITGREKSQEKHTNKIENFKNSMTKTQLTGCILIGVAFLSLLVPFGAFVTFPIVLCAMICLLVKKNAWYWCIWVVYLPLQFGLNWGTVFFIPHIIETVFIAIMAVITCKIFSKENVEFSKIKSKTILIGCIVYDILYVVGIFGIFYLGWLLDFDVSEIGGTVVSGITAYGTLGYAIINLILTAGIGATLIGITLSVKNLKKQN